MLYIIRHLETNWNKNWLCQGWKSWRILKNSYWIYDDTINIFKKIKFDHIISSDLYRAKKTALYIKKHIWFKNNTKYYKYFREINFWDFEWKHYKNIKLLQPEIYDVNWFFTYDVKLKNWESIDDLKKRVILWLKKINNIEWNILLVCHWNVIKMIHSIFYNIDYNDSYINLNIKHWKFYKFNNTLLWKRKNY